MEFVKPYNYDGPSPETRRRSIDDAVADEERRIAEARASGLNKYQRPGIVGWMEGANTPVPPSRDVALGGQPTPTPTPAPAQRAIETEMEDAPRQYQPHAPKNIPQEDEFDARERAYMADPEAFERERMARGPVSGELRVAVGNRPMQSYNVGANRGDVRGVDGAASLRDDKVFGQSRTTPKGPGALSMTGGEDNNANAAGGEAHLRYLSNAGRLDDYFAEEADISRDAMLANDPLAIERGRAEIQGMADTRAVAKAAAIEEARQAAKFSQYDRAIDSETALDVQRLLDMPDGSQTPYGPMTSGLRAELVQNAKLRNAEQKREIRARAFRAPAATEMDLG